MVGAVLGINVTVASVDVSQDRRQVVEVSVSVSSVEGGIKHDGEQWPTDEDDDDDVDRLRLDLKCSPLLSSCATAASNIDNDDW